MFATISYIFSYWKVTVASLKTIQRKQWVNTDSPLLSMQIVILRNNQVIHLEQ